MPNKSARLTLLEDKAVVLNALVDKLEAILDDEHMAPQHKVRELRIEAVKTRAALAFLDPDGEKAPF